MNIFFFSFYLMILFLLHGNISLQEKDVRGKILTKELFGLEKSRYWNCHKRISDKLLE